MLYTNLFSSLSALIWVLLTGEFVAAVQVEAMGGRVLYLHIRLRIGRLSNLLSCVHDTASPVFASPVLQRAPDLLFSVHVSRSGDLLRCTLLRHADQTIWYCGGHHR